MTIKPNTPAERAMLVQLPEGTDVEWRHLCSERGGKAPVSGYWSFDLFRYDLPKPKPRTIRVEFECPMPVVEAPKKGEVYWSAGSVAIGDTWDGWSSELAMLAAGLIFKTREDAEAYIAAREEAVARAVNQEKARG